MSPIQWLWRNDIVINDIHSWSTKLHKIHNHFIGYILTIFLVDNERKWYEEGSSCFWCYWSFSLCLTEQSRGLSDSFHECTKCQSSVTFVEWMNVLEVIVLYINISWYVCFYMKYVLKFVFMYNLIVIGKGFAVWIYFQLYISQGHLVLWRTFWVFRAQLTDSWQMRRMALQTTMFRGIVVCSSLDQSISFLLSGLFLVSIWYMSCVCVVLHRPACILCASLYIYGFKENIH